MNQKEIYIKGRYTEGQTIWIFSEAMFSHGESAFVGKIALVEKEFVCFQIGTGIPIYADFYTLESGIKIHCASAQADYNNPEEMARFQGGSP